MQTQFELERKRRWGRGKTLLAYCQHGKQIIKNYEPFEECLNCDGGKQAHFVHGRTHFNRTLNKEFSSLRESEKYAKRKGYEPIGDVPLNKVSKSLWPNHPMTQNCDL